MTDKEVVLVTGASGFIGSQLVQLLSESDAYRIIAVDARHTGRSDAFDARADVQVCDLDLRDRSALEAVMPGVHRIVHLAALRPAAAAKTPRTAFEVNVAATYDLIELAAQHGVRRIVFGSSHSVYGSFRQRREYRFREAEVADGS